MDFPRRRGIALGVGVLLVIFGSLASVGPLVRWGAAVLVLAAASMAWAAVAWRGVHVTVKFRRERVFVSEVVEVVVRIENRKRVSLPWVRVGVWLPPGLERGDDRRVDTIRGFRRRLTMSGNSQATMTFPLRATGRGEYRLRLVEMTISDPFGLVPMTQELIPPEALLVMPEPRIGVPVETRRRLPFGTPAVAARMFEEPERFAGIRPYAAGDPLNRIHWKASGHSGGLQTKIFEPTRGADALFAMDLSVGEPFWDAIYPEIAEDTIGWTAFLARLAIDAGWRVGLIANTHLTHGRGPLRVLPSSARGHEAAIFAAMARMPNEPTSDLAPLLREAGRHLGRTLTAVVVSPRPGPWLRQEIDVVRRRGIEVVAVSPLEPLRVMTASTGFTVPTRRTDSHGSGDAAGQSGART